MGYLVDLKREDGAFLRAYLAEKSEFGECVVVIRANASGFSTNQAYVLDELELRTFGGQVRELHRSLGASVQLNSVDGQIGVSLEHDGRGHYKFDFLLHSQYPHNDRLILNFQMDQTELLGLAESFSNLVIDPELVNE